MTQFSIGEYVIKFLVESSNAETGAKNVTKTLGDVEKQAEKTSKSTKSLAQGAGDLKASFSGLQAVLAGGVVAGIIRFGFEAVKLGTELQVLRDNFSGTNQDLELFRKATAGTVGEAGLIKLSNQASDLGVSLKDQALLFSLAEDAGDKYGGSVEENFNRVILATDGSTRGLRALGITVTEFNIKMKELEAATGKRLTQMSAEEQLNLRLKAIYELTGTTIDKVKNKTVDAADKLDGLRVAANDLIAVFGDKLVTAFGKSELAAKDVGKEMRALKDLSADLGSISGEILGGLSNKILEMVRQDMKDIERLVNWYNRWKPAFLPEIGNPFQDSTDSRQAEIMGGDFLFGKMPTLDTDAYSRMFGDSGSDNTSGTSGRGSTRTSRETEEKVKLLSDRFVGLALANLAAEVNRSSIAGLQALSINDALGRIGYTGNDAPEEIKDAGEDFKFNIQAALSDAQNIASILGLGAENFFNYINDAFSLLNSISNLIITFGGGGILGSIGSFLGLGGSIATWTQGGGLSASLGGRASAGTLAMGSGAGQVYLIGGTIKGKDIRLSLQRTTASEGRLTQ